MELTGAQLLVKALKMEGTKHIFGVSGSAVLPIMDVLYHDREVRYIQSQHEQGAMYMANGYARATRALGVCLVSPGPGSTNCLSGVGQAFYTSTSSLLICIESGTEHLGLGTSLHHDLDSVAVFKPVTKLAIRVERIDRLVESIQKAFNVALSGRRGPVYLGIPKDILSAQIDDKVLSRKRYPVETAPRATSESIRRTADILLAGKRPVALAGGGAVWSQAQEVLLELAEHLAMPVAFSRDNKGLIPEDHILALGAVGLASTPWSLQAMQSADVLLAVGCTFGEFTTRMFGHEVVPEGVQIIQIDIDPTEIGKIYPVTQGIFGDARTVLQDLLEEVKKRNIDRRPLEEVPWIQQLMQAKKQWRESLAPLETSDQAPILWPRLLRDLRRALPRNAIVSAVSGSTCSWFNYGFEALAHTCSTGGWHPLGSEYPESLGVQVALPDRVVVCLIGDGAMMMTLQEIATAAAYDIPMLCVVSHNGFFGNMRQTQITRFGGRFMGTDLPIPNLSNIARELGAYAERVEDPAEIIPAVGRALGSGKASLLEVMMDTSDENLVPGPRRKG
ncbi:MAG: thiamine pyrophosphate-binding protein [Desulfobacterales bacterium]|nr:thiamine pyrophosphate-binding protein [Desulfobacterales bacterium]